MYLFDCYPVVDVEWHFHQLIIRFFSKNNPHKVPQHVINKELIITGYKSFGAAFLFFLSLTYPPSWVTSPRRRGVQPLRKALEGLLRVASPSCTEYMNELPQNRKWNFDFFRPDFDMAKTLKSSCQISPSHLFSLGMISSNYLEFMFCGPHAKVG